MRSKKLNPAEYVILVFGGVNATARALNRSPGSVSMWRAPKSKKGLGGRIPSQAQLLILKKAKQLKLDITPDDLIDGRTISLKRVL